MYVHCKVYVCYIRSSLDPGFIIEWFNYIDRVNKMEDMVWLLRPSTLQLTHVRVTVMLIALSSTSVLELCVVLCIERLRIN